MNRCLIQIIFSTFCLIWLSACGRFSDETQTEEVEQLPPLIPHSEPLSSTGNHPYVVDDVLYTPVIDPVEHTERGIASWYGKKFHGKKTSSGEIYDMYTISAAHKTLPIPSYVQVTNLVNKKSLIVRVNDRGPFVGSRILDLSYAAAKELGFVTTGTTQIELKAIVNQSETVKPPVQAKVFLQTGVYAEKVNAAQAKNELESQGYSVKVDDTSSSLYKVMVGPYGTAELAYNEKLVLEQQLRQPVMLITEQP